MDNRPSIMTRSHILVVDDEPEIAESVSEYLTRTGYYISLADSGHGALSFLERANSEGNAVDLVLLDMRMPDLTGQQVLERLRSHPHPDLQYTRVIMLTAATGSHDKIEALNAGADDYITKPYHPQELVARVQTLLRTQQLEKQLQRQSQQLAGLNRVSQEVTATLDVRSVYSKCTQGVQEALKVEAAAVFVKANTRSQILCQHISGPDLGAVPYPPIPFGMGIIGQTAEQPTIFRANDLTQLPQYEPSTDSPPGLELRSLLSVPIIVRGRVWGVLAAYNRVDGRPFTEFDLDLLASLSTSLSYAIENAWLVQNLQTRQQELLDSRNTLQAIIDGILHPIYTIDATWHVVTINQAKLDDIASSSDTVIGQPCYQVFYQRNSPCEHCQAAHVLQESQPRSWSVRWLGDDHLPREWDVNAYPVPGQQVGSATAVVVWQDRTEERRLEQSLLQAGKLAAIGQLAAGVAHEINNPLTAVNANAEMLKMFIDQEDDNYESVDLIHRAGLRAAKVVRGLLDFAREQQYTFRPIDINESIEQALDLVAYQLQIAHVSTVNNLTPDIPYVPASSEHIKSVWINLMINARDAMRDAKTVDPQLELRTRLVPATGPIGEQIEVIIRDNGPGISPAEAAHIFEPFYTTKDPGKGTGLGLATCHRIIEQHGGRIEMISEIGHGATFVVLLPVSE